VALTGQQNLLTATALALTATASTVNQLMTPTGTPVGVVSNIPVVNVGCLGDEQMWFVPRKPNVGVHVQISVTSQRHHDARAMALGGPLDSGPVVEHIGPLGFIWTWTVVPTVEDFYQWTFFADGLRPCITSGFNAFAPLGATPTPTITPQPTNTPGTATPTPTQTSVPAPTISGVSNSRALTCGQVVTITGGNFGSPPSSFGTAVTLTNGGNTFVLSLVGTGSNTSLLVNMPPSGSSINANLATNIIVSNSGGNSSPFPVQFAASTTNPTATPTGTLPPGPTSTPAPGPAAGC
jgi:hypothetical protein